MFKIIPGPMHGVMSPLWVKTMTHLKLIDCWLAPFIRISTHVPHEKKVKLFLQPFIDSNLPLEAQLMGNNSVLIAETAKQLQKINIFDINLNFACPSKTVLGKNGGGRLLSNYDLMSDIICAIRKMSPETKLSVKIRSGFEDWKEIEKLIPFFKSFDLEYIALHFRTVVENYKDIEGRVERMKRATELAGDLDIIGSGDIYTVDDFKAMCENANCAGAMAARGLLKDPFLIQKIKGTYKSIPNEKLFFLKTMVRLAQKNNQPPRWRNNFLEIVKNIYGEDSDFFSQIKTKTVDDIYDEYSSWQ